MKPTAAAAFLFAILIVTLAEASVYRSDTSCQKVMMQKSIDECRSFMKFGRPGPVMTSDTEEAPEECCQQLREVPHKCRCEMIKMTAQEMRQEGSGGGECRGPCSEMMMRAKYLPAMCDVGPRSCRMNMGSSSSDAY